MSCLNFSIFAASLRANGTTPMKDGLLMALQEIVKNGKELCDERFFFPQVKEV